VGYGVIKQNIRIEDIEKVQIHYPPWYQYGGLGLRIGWDLTYRVYYNFGVGVRIKPKKGVKIVSTPIIRKRFRKHYLILNRGNMIMLTSVIKFK
jgi:hypothetical protein